MQNNKKIFFTIFLIIFCNGLKAQDALKTQFNFAKTLYENEKYFDAITELKRLIFFDSSKTYFYEANKIIGDCYKMGGKFSEAILYYANSENAAISDSEIFDERINQIRVNILRRTTDRALMMLDNLSSDKRFLNKINCINYWKGWSYIFSDDWEKAANAFAKTDSSSKLVAFCKEVHSKKYSISFATLISHFIPGAGQIYAGHIWSGLLSLGWNVLWGYTSINAFIDNRIFDGIIVSDLLWLRFYIGNIQNAEKFSKEENLSITNSALHFLQFEYRGVKP